MAKYCCNHCDYSSVSHHYINHLIKNHKDDLYNNTTKDTINASIKSLGGRALPIFSIKMKNSKEKHFIHICFGCNKFWERPELAYKHVNECGNKLKHKETLKSFKPTSDQVVENSSDDVAILKEKIATLENELKTIKDFKKIEYHQKQADIDNEYNETYKMNNMDSDGESGETDLDVKNAEAYNILMMFFLEKKDEDFRDNLRDELIEYNNTIDWTDHL